MIKIAFLFFLHMGLDLGINSATYFPDTNLLDTIPATETILYKEDSSVHHSRQTLYLSNFSRLMRLPSFHEETHELLIRAWLWDFGEHYVINICKDSSQYSSSVIAWHTKRVDSNVYILIDSQWSALKPKSGWSQFFNTLNDYQIRKMTSGLPFEKHTSRLTQSSYVQFEVKEKGTYRFYEYLEPSYYRFVESGASNVYKFLKYFDQQMGLTIYLPDESLYQRK